MALHNPAEDRARRRGGFTQGKAKKVLSEARPTLRGKPITSKQRGLLGLVAGGGTPSRTKKKSQLSALKRNTEHGEK